MSRKPTKGYYVRGQFVAEGSELDLAYKAELKGTDAASKTDLKRESTELQSLGEDLLTLRKGLLTKLDLPDKLLDAVAEAKRITNFEGKRRQMQFIGKLMRLLQVASPGALDAIKAALAEQHNGSAQTTLAVHQAEQWRERLIKLDDAFAEWLQAHPDTDTQQLRALIRQARKDAAAAPVAVLAATPTEGNVTAPATTAAPAAARQGRAYRELFQLVREQLTPVISTDDADADEDDDES
jgi:ribosome-associated protein